MDATYIDFEGTGNQGQGSSPVEDTSGAGGNPGQQEDTTALNGNDKDDITNNGGDNNNPPADTSNQDDTNNSVTGELGVGDTIDVDGTIYTIAENGDLVNDKGEVFKEAKDVKDWLASVEVEDENADSSITLSAIQEALGVTITDEEGKDVAFTDDAAGVKAYVD